jgi:hypothetical protein
MKPPWKLATIGLLCAVPFGLAVRDELRGPAHAASQVGPDALFAGDADDDPDDAPGDDPGDDVDDSAQPAVALGDDTGLHYGAPDEPATLADMRPLVEQLTGATPGSLGPLFTGIHLGASSQDFLSDEARSRVEVFKDQHDATIDFDFDEREVLAIDASLAWPAVVRDVLISRWGQPSDDNVWIDGKGQRLALSARDGRAHLRWSPYQSESQLVAPADRARLGIEPFPVVGASLAKLEAALGARLVESDDYDNQYAWDSPAMPDGDQPVTATVEVRNGTVVSLTVVTFGGDPEALRAALVAKYGKPTSGDGQPWESLVWRSGKRTIEALVGDDGMRLTIHR